MPLEEDIGEFESCIVVSSYLSQFTTFVRYQKRMLSIRKSKSLILPSNGRKNESFLLTRYSSCPISRKKAVVL